MDAAAGRLTWEPPGEGVWWLTREHFPRPVSRLFATLFPPVTRGWSDGAERLGLPLGTARWAAVNGWLYFSPGPEDPALYPSLDETARRALETRAWCDEVEWWFGVERPRAVAVNQELQAVNLSELDDEALVDRLQRTIDHFLAVAPLHFEHLGIEIAAGMLFLDATRWGIPVAEVAALLAGSSPASTSAPAHIDRISDALAADAIDHQALTTLVQVRLANPAAAEALDTYLAEHGNRLIHGHDVAEPTLIERPDLVLASIRARLAARAAAGEAERPGGIGRPSGRPAPELAAAIAAVRARVPPGHRGRFDDLVAEARRLYQLRDDDVGICVTWPLGLVRRVVLEIAGRLRGRGLLDDADHLFEADPPEIAALAVAGPGPGSHRAIAAELADRAALRALAAGAEPPFQLGRGPADTAEADRPGHVATLAAARDAYWRASAAIVDRRLAGIGIGDRTVRGRAFVAEGAGAALDGIEPGDVLVTMTTTAAYDAIFPIVAAVVTEAGGLFSHTAILARELDTPAVVGVPGVLAAIGHGDVVEVDAGTGTVRVIEHGSPDG